MSALHEFEEPQTVAARRADATFSLRRLAPEHGPDTAVLTVRGEIELGTAPMLREALRPVLERQAGPVVVDLCEVSFMDSTGVHVLLDTLGRLEAQNRRLAIACREHSQVGRLLALVGLLDALSVHRSRRSAVAGGGDVVRSHLPGGRARRSFGSERATSQPSRRISRIHES